MKKRKIITGIAFVLSLSLLSGCNKEENTPAQEQEEVIHHSPEDTETVDVDEEYAKEVVDLINALNENSTEEDIINALNKYNDLTARQKLLVSNYSKLQEYENLLDVLRMVTRINSLIEALDEDNPNASDVEEAKKGYIEIKELYGEEWQNKISEENVNKLNRCEKKVFETAVKPLILKAVNLDLKVLREGTQFTLLNKRILDLEAVFSNTLFEELEEYESFLAKREKASERYEIAADDYYSTTHGIGDKFLTQIPTMEDDDYGYVSYEEFNDYQFADEFRAGDIQVATRHSYEAYEKIALFVNWPFYIDHLTIINHEEGLFLTSHTLVNQYIYIEIPVKQLKDKKGVDYTHISGFLEDKNVGAEEGIKYKYTAIVGIGVDKDAAQEAVNEVDSMIEALTSSSSVEDINAAREAYNALATNYGVEWQQKVKEENVNKLIELENVAAVKEINALIATANSIELGNNRSYVQFALLSDSISEKYLTLDEAKKNLLVGYDDYLVKKESADNKAIALYNSNITSSTLGLTKVSDSNYGHIFKESYSPYRKAAIEINLNDMGANWSNYLRFGFFAKYDVVNDENLILPLNSTWSKTVYATRTLIDSENHLYYYEYDLSSVNEALPNDFNPYIQLYFSNNTKEYMITGIVAFIDNSAAELNNYIANANAIDITNNAGKAHFQLLSSFIDTKYNTLSPAKQAELEDYDIYQTKKAQITNCSILFDETFTTEYSSGNYGELDSNSSDMFGMVRKFSYETSKTGIVSLFAIASGQNWNGHSKLGFFFKVDGSPSSVDMVIDNKYADRKAATPTIYDSENNIYYVEFDISFITTTLSGNPYFLIYVDSTSTLLSTNIVYFD